MTQKKACPKDADTTAFKDQCMELFQKTHNTAYRCTRKKGHEGYHHAHNFRRKCIKVWK